MIAFRDIADVDTMLEVAAKQHGKAVVIGGGLLGLEAANGLLKQGMDVTVVHLMDCLMERQLDKPAAALLKASLEAEGPEVPDAGADRSHPRQGQGRSRAFQGRAGGRGRPGGDGGRHSCQLSRWRKTSACTASAVWWSTTPCRPSTRASMPSVSAFSIAAQTYGLVAPLFEQAKVCANHLAHIGIARYEGSRDLDQAEGYGYRPVFRRRLYR